MDYNFVWLAMDDEPENATHSLFYRENMIECFVGLLNALVMMRFS